MAANKEISRTSNGMSKGNKKMWTLVVIFGLLLLSPFVLYMCYFCGGITSDHSRWAQFGDYIAGIASVLNVIAFVVLTIVINSYEKEQSERSVRFHAEELVITKIQMNVNMFGRMYVAYKNNNNKDIVHDSFDELQPLMSYFYYLKNMGFLPHSTKDLIGQIHSYFFEASDIMYSYIEDIERNGNVPSVVDILKVYREIERRLIELEVKMTADIAEISSNEEVSTNYYENILN